MAQKRKILYVCQQVDPYIAQTPRSVATRNLLQGMNERDYEIRTFMPRYGTINERRNQLHEVIRLSGMNLIIDDTDHQLIIKVASIPSARVQIYFIDNDDYFSRKAILEDETGKEFEDNDERAIFFSRGVLETVKKLRWEPSIIHTHGWFSGLVAAYLRHTFADDPIFAGVKVVVSLDCDGFREALDPAFRSKLEGEGIVGENLEFITEPTYENYCRFVISYADAVVISSKECDEKVVEIARASGKPFLEYQDPEEADYYDNYAKFYETL
ncbi:MAG: glycogen/starch synthase [Rikenellaceae bacterium]